MNQSINTDSKNSKEPQQKYRLGTVKPAWQRYTASPKANHLADWAIWSYLGTPSFIGLGCSSSPSVHNPSHQTFKTYEPPHDKTNKLACAPSEDSDQPENPPSLIRVFIVRMKKAWVLSYPLSAQRRLWSDWTDARIHFYHWPLFSGVDLSVISFNVFRRLLRQC